MLAANVHTELRLLFGLIKEVLSPQRPACSVSWTSSPAPAPLPLSTWSRSRLWPGSSPTSCTSRYASMSSRSAPPPPPLLFVSVIHCSSFSSCSSSPFLIAPDDQPRHPEWLQLLPSHHQPHANQQPVCKQTSPKCIWKSKICCNDWTRIKNHMNAVKWRPVYKRWLQPRL